VTPLLTGSRAHFTLVRDTDANLARILNVRPVATPRQRAPLAQARVTPTASNAGRAGDL
jgi:hypothetical protein